MNINIKIIIILLICFLIILISPFIGTNSLKFSNILVDKTVDNYIFFNARLLRIVAGFIVGGVLAVSGLVFQSIFKNPIATPFTLGVASGASLGAAIYVYFAQAVSYIAIFGQTLAAMVGALITIFIVYSVSFLKGKLSNATLLLAGVAVNFFTSALIMFIQYFADTTQIYKITRYMIGSLSSILQENILFILPISFLFFTVIYSFHKELDILSMGDYIAESRGVNITRSITFLYFIVSFAIASVIAVAGPIGFIGMMIPHIIRMILTFKNKILVPMSFIFGGAFLVLCDSIARVIIAPIELPVAVITSLLGAPFFIFLIIKDKKI